MYGLGQIDKFLDETNAMHKDMKLFVKEENKIINYLDLILTLNSNKIDNRIY